MTAILVPTRGAADWRCRLADPARQWRPGYSAMATARSWEAAGGLPPEISALLAPAPELLFAIPEHRVPLPGGSRESQCDVFALVRSGAGPSRSPSRRRSTSHSTGRWGNGWPMARPESACGLPASARSSVAPSRPADCATSCSTDAPPAIIEASRFNCDAAAMIVHSFSQDHRWYDDFAAFCRFLEVEPERGAPLIRKLPDGRDLIFGWATGAPEFLA